MGLSKVFATGNPDSSNWRANQLFTRPTIIEFQKDLERVLDWVFWRFIKYTIKQNKLEYIDSNIMDYVDWQWPKMDELDVQAY